VIQFHTDPKSPRVGILAARTLNFEKVGLGIVVNDLNRAGSVRHPQCIQTFVYKLITNKGDFIIETAYIVPNCNKNALDQFINHINNQALKHKNYILGGDLNLNQKEKVNRELIGDATALTQIIKDYTRVRTVHFKNGKNKGKDRTSKTIIDLIFNNEGAQRYTKNFGVESLWDGFDHYGVYINIDTPPAEPFKYVKTPLHPLERPEPSPQTIQEMIHTAS